MLTTLCQEGALLLTHGTFARGGGGRPEPGRPWIGARLDKAEPGEPETRPTESQRPNPAIDGNRSCRGSTRDADVAQVGADGFVGRGVGHLRAKDEAHVLGRLHLHRHFAAKPYVRKPQAVAGNTAARGREVYERLCQICHLDQGRATTYAEYPLLAGQSLPYMQKQMALILGQRRSVEVTKRGMLDLLSPQQIDDAMHFFASQQVSPDQVAGGLTTTEKRTRRRRFRSEPLADEADG